MPLQYFIFLDANFLLIPAQFKVDIYEQFRQLIPGPYQIVVISAVIDELTHKISNLSPTSSLRQQVKLALQILERESHHILEKPRPADPNIGVDDWILQVMLDYKENFAETELYLATNDKNLRKKALENRFPTVFLRKKQRLEVELPNF